MSIQYVSTVATEPPHLVGINGSQSHLGSFRTASRKRGCFRELGRGAFVVFNTGSLYGIKHSQEKMKPGMGQSVTRCRVVPFYPFSGGGFPY